MFANHKSDCYILVTLRRRLFVIFIITALLCIVSIRYKLSLFDHSVHFSRSDLANWWASCSTIHHSVPQMLSACPIHPSFSSCAWGRKTDCPPDQVFYRYFITLSPRYFLHVRIFSWCDWEILYHQSIVCSKKTKSPSPNQPASSSLILHQVFRRRHRLSTFYPAKPGR